VHAAANANDLIVIKVVSHENNISISGKHTILWMVIPNQITKKYKNDHN